MIWWLWINEVGGAIDWDFTRSPCHFTGPSYALIKRVQITLGKAPYKNAHFWEFSHFESFWYGNPSLSDDRTQYISAQHGIGLAPSGVQNQVDWGGGPATLPPILREHMIDPTKGLGEPGLLVMVNGSQFLVATKYQVLLELVLGVSS